MIKNLVKFKGLFIENKSGISGDLSGIRGDLSSIGGDLTGIRGNLSGIMGNADSCEISENDRKLGIKVEDLIL